MGSISGRHLAGGRNHDVQWLPVRWLEHQGRWFGHHCRQSLRRLGLRPSGRGQYLGLYDHGNLPWWRGHRRNLLVWGRQFSRYGGRNDPNDPDQQRSGNHTGRWRSRFRAAASPPPIRRDPISGRRGLCGEAVRTTWFCCVGSGTADEGGPCDPLDRPQPPPTETRLIEA